MVGANLGTRYGMYTSVDRPEVVHEVSIVMDICQRDDLNWSSEMHLS